MNIPSLPEGFELANESINSVQDTNLPPLPEGFELQPMEQPSIEQPSIEQPSIEQPSIEQPSIEQPSIEQPSIEQPSNIDMVQSEDNTSTMTQEQVNTSESSDLLSDIYDSATLFIAGARIPTAAAAVTIKDTLGMDSTKEVEAYTKLKEYIKDNGSDDILSAENIGQSATYALAYAKTGLSVAKNFGVGATLGATEEWANSKDASKALVKGIEHGLIDAGITKALSVAGTVFTKAINGELVDSAKDLVSPIKSTTRANITKIVQEQPELGNDMLKAISFASEHDITIPKTAWEGAGKEAKTGNAFMDTLITNIKKKYKDVETSQLVEMSNNLSKSDLTVNKMAKVVQDEMTKVYTSRKTEADQAWKRFSENYDPELAITKDWENGLFKKIDSTISNATVRDFVKRTLLGSRTGLDTVGQNIKDKIISLKDTKALALKGKRGAARAASEKYYNNEIKKLEYEFKATEKERIGKTITLGDLLKAKQEFNHKVYVKGGTIDGGNQLQLGELKQINSIVDETLDNLVPKEAQALYTDAKQKSSKLFDLFGYALSGKNKGIKTNIDGKILNANEIGVIEKFNSALMVNDKAGAVEAFKQYGKILPESAMKDIKKTYASKILGISPKQLVDTSSLSKGYNLSTTKVDNVLSDIVSTQDGRELAKEIYGTKGLDNFIALHKLNNLIGKNVGEPTTFWREATSAYDASLAGVAKGTAKLLKSLTWDALTYPAKKGTINEYTKNLTRNLLTEFKKSKPNVHKLQAMLITGASLGLVSNSNATDYTVLPGDNLSKIAKRLNTTVNSIKKDNNLTTNSLKPGQQLKVYYEPKKLNTGIDMTMGAPTEYEVPKYIKDVEGFNSKVKLVMGHPTIGYGYDLKQNSKYKTNDFKAAGIKNLKYGIDEQQASVLYNRVSTRVESSLNRVLEDKYNKLPTKVKDLVFMLAYNGDIQSGGRHGKLLKYLKSGGNDYNKIKESVINIDKKLSSNRLTNRLINYEAK